MVQLRASSDAHYARSGELRRRAPEAETMTRADRHYQERALHEGMAVAVVREAGNRAGGCKCRRVVEVVVSEMEQRKAKAGRPGATSTVPRNDQFEIE